MMHVCSEVRCGGCKARLAVASAWCMCIARFAVSQIQDACVCLLDDAINIVALALPDREWKEVSAAALLVLVLVIL